jgi:translation initiation factor IF-3
LTRAQEAGLDLVEVAPDANPPVCRFMDYGKFKYQQKKRQHLSRQKQHLVQVKYLRLSPKIDEHDLEIKVKKAREFLERKDKVVLTMRFRGQRELAHTDLAQAVLARIAQELQNVAKVEKQPVLTGRIMNMTLVPK